MTRESPLYGAYVKNLPLPIAMGDSRSECLENALVVLNDVSMDPKDPYHNEACKILQNPVISNDLQINRMVVA